MPDAVFYCYNACLTVCVSDESMQKCFGEGSGLVYQDVLSWLQSSNTQLQLSGALAIANFARNGEIFTGEELLYLCFECIPLKPELNLVEHWIV